MNWAFLQGLFGFDGFMPHGCCYQWTEPLIALHVVSDGLTFLAYMSLPLTMLWLVRMKRDMPFNWMFVLFLTWISLCGVVHLLDVVTIWYPLYWLLATVKLVLAIGSVPTALLLKKIVPLALAIPSPQALREANGRLVAANAELESLTAALSQARDRAIESTNLKAQFLANTSHELRTPVAAILGIAEILGETALNDEQKEIVQAIDESGRSLLTVINDVLDFSKIEASKFELECIPFAMSTLTEAVMREASARAGSRSLSVTASVDPAIPQMLNGDPVRLRQILTNICDTASKITEGDRLSIEVQLEHQETDTSTIKFAVSCPDAGTFSDAAVLLSQPHSIGYRSGAGISDFDDSGLGLAVCQKLIRLMGGELKIVGEQPNGGSTFCFSLQFGHVGGNPLPDPGGQETAGGQSLGQVLVLVVDDSPVLRQVTAAQLKRLGVAVHVACNGLEALKAVSEFKYSLVLMDCQMPQMDGYQTAQAIRESEKSSDSHLCIVGLTASTLNEDLEKCANAGMDDCLSKPVSLEQLKILVEQVTE